MFDTKTTLITIIHRHLPGCQIMLFGSRARRTNKDGADYDIALDAGYAIPRQVMVHITSDIEESRVPVHVDVVDLNNISEEFAQAIKKDLVPWTKT